MNIVLQIVLDINNLKAKLKNKAKSKGLYKNFGQREVRELEEKYLEQIKGDYRGLNEDDGKVWGLISKFNTWCMNFNDSDLRGS